MSCLCGVLVSLQKHLDRRNEADEAPGAPPKLANLTPNIDCSELHPQMKGTSPAFSPDDEPGNPTKPGGPWRAAFDLFD